MSSQTVRTRSAASRAGRSQRAEPGRRSGEIVDGGEGRFSDAERRLKRLNEKQEGKQKTHPQQQTSGIVRRLFEDHGFIENLEGRDVYFHRNAVINQEFDRLTIGAGVNYTVELGNDGLQASSVRIVDRPGK